MDAPSLPPSLAPPLPSRLPRTAVYSEDAVEGVLGMLRYQLTYNIYPFYDGRLAAAARPKLAEQAAAAAAEEEGGSAKKKGRGGGKKGKAGAGAAGVK